MSSIPVTLPEGFSAIVKVGDTVISGQVLAQKKGDSEQIINIPQQLKVSLKNVKHVLKKNPGDPVHKGDVIAEKKGFLGMDNASIISNVEGIVFRYERGTGNLVVRTSFDVPENVICPVAGTIALCDNDKIIVRVEEEASSESASSEKDEATNVAEETDSDDVEVITVGPAKKRESVAVLGYGEPTEGELFVLKKSFSESDLSNALYSLTGEASEKIVLARGFTREMLMKGVGIGVIGFIGSEIGKEDLEFFVEREPKIAIMQIDEDTIERLEHWEGRKLRMNGEEKSISLIL